jgi:hypothetical protein
MYSIILEWKSFPVSMKDIAVWAKMECGEHSSGMSANTKLEFHFTQEPSQLVKDKVQAMWDQLGEEVEATKLAHWAQQDRAVKYARDNIPYADFATLLPAERKMWMGAELSDPDKEAIAAKYPNV